MEYVLSQPVKQLILAGPYFVYTLLIGLFEWMIPGSWYAKDVQHDIVLITGAGSGLGRAIALEFAKLGCSLVLWDINVDGLATTKELVAKEHEQFHMEEKTNNINKKCLTYRVDVSDRLEVQRFSETVMIDLNKSRASDEPEAFVSVLVNNAGIYHGLMLQELRDDQIERIFKINVLAHFWTVRSFLPKMIEHERGHIVEIASMGGIAGLLKQVDYCATKFATVGFEESLSIELDHMGLSRKIYTTAVCPFFFQSNLFTGFDSARGALMTPEFVAQETVLAMRCNHSRVMLPKLSSYALFIAKAYLPRKSLICLTKALGFAESIKQIKGAASTPSGANKLR